MRNTKFLLFATIVLTTVFSCTYVKENAANTACDLTNIKYSNTVGKIMSDYCTGCHGGALPSANISLDSYDSLKKYVNNGSLIGSMKHSSSYSPMPKGSAKLDICTIDKVQKWIDNGALND
jgi:hypothetical protein